MKSKATGVGIGGRDCTSSFKRRGRKVRGPQGRGNSHLTASMFSMKQEARSAAGGVKWGVVGGKSRDLSVSQD